MPFLLSCSAVCSLSLLNGRRAVFLPNTVNSLGHTAFISGDEEKHCLARPLKLCFKQQEKHLDQKESVCAQAIKQTAGARPLRTGKESVSPCMELQAGEC